MIMDDLIFSETRLVLKHVDANQVLIHARKRYLWVIPLFIFVYSTIYIGTVWSDSPLLFGIQVILISILPVLFLNGVMNMFVFKLEINQSQISRRQALFPFLIKTETWPVNTIQNLRLKTNDGKNTDNWNFDLCICQSDKDIVLLRLRKKNDNMTVPKLKQIGELFSTVINKPLLYNP